MVRPESFGLVLGGQRGSAEGERRKLRSLVGSVARGDADRADRWGALEGVAPCDLALRFEGMVEVVEVLDLGSSEMFAPSDFGEVPVPIGFSGSGTCLSCAFFTITKAQRSKIE